MRRRPSTGLVPNFTALFPAVEELGGRVDKGMMWLRLLHCLYRGGTAKAQGTGAEEEGGGGGREETTTEFGGCGVVQRHVPRQGFPWPHPLPAADTTGGAVSGTEAGMTSS